MSTLRLVHYALFLTHACWKSNNTNARLMVFTLSLALDPTVGKHDGNLSHGKFSYSFLFAHFQNPPFLRSLAVLLNSSAGWMIALPSSAFRIVCRQDTDQWTPKSTITVSCIMHLLSKAGGGGGGGGGERETTLAQVILITFLRR